VLGATEAGDVPVLPATGATSASVGLLALGLALSLRVGISGPRRGPRWP
jgi:LPXTG-motif cell wall-anchored protein